MRAVFVGEGMLELSGDTGVWRLGHGGDTLNTAIHMARSGADVAFATALGDDPFSDELKRTWAGEGLDISLVLVDPAHRPGLYAIRLDAAGERSFFYWRGESAARRMFAHPQATTFVTAARGAELLCFSLISLAILDDAGRHALLDLARLVRAAGGIVAFDGNYRPSLWSDRATAIRWRDAAIAETTIGLPTAEDEASLSGEEDAEAVEQHWRRTGAGEVVVKMGAAGCRLSGGVVVPPPTSLIPVDTSGAGDAFNAGYLLGRTRGEAPACAAAAGHRLAGWVIQRRGAVPGRDVDAPYWHAD